MTEDALDALRERCKKIKHGSIENIVIIKDGVPFEVVIGKVVEKLRAKKKT